MDGCAESEKSTPSSEGSAAKRCAVPPCAVPAEAKIEEEEEAPAPNSRPPAVAPDCTPPKRGAVEPPDPKAGVLPPKPPHPPPAFPNKPPAIAATPTPPVLLCPAPPPNGIDAPEEAAGPNENMLEDASALPVAATVSLPVGNAKLLDEGSLSGDTLAPNAPNRLPAPPAGEARLLPGGAKRAEEVVDEGGAC